MSERSLRYAAMHAPAIGAIVNGLFRFANEQEARQQRARLLHSFSLSRKYAISDTPALWIKNFGITEEEAAEGYMGNYAHIVCETCNDKWTLRAQKLIIPLKHHPQRRYLVKNPHPNWGHPVLRRVRQKKPFANVEEAQQKLMDLHEEYPHTTIPGLGVLYLMIYGAPPDEKKPSEEKDGKAQPPIHKYILSLKPAPDGGCLIDWRRNNRQKKRSPAPNNPAPAGGFFSTLVKVQRSRKKPGAKP